jgi:peroxiredoxin
LPPGASLRYNFFMGIWKQISRWMGANRGMTHIVAGNTAPGFSLKSLDGQEFSLSSAKTRGPVVAAFFKVSCPVCQFTFPFLERIYKRYGSADVTIVGISQDDAAATKKFMTQYGVTFPVLLDGSGYPASNAYGLTSVPTIFLIESDGSVKVSAMGFDKQELENMARELAARKKEVPAALFLPTEEVPSHKPG